MPVLPNDKKLRYIEEYALSEYDAGVLVSSRDIAKFFEECISLKVNPKIATNWLIGTITAYLNEKGTELGDLDFDPIQLKELTDLIEKGTISNKIAKDIFPEIIESGNSAIKIVEEKGLTQINNTDEIASLVKELVEKNPKQVEEYLGGKEKVLGYFVGQIMKTTKGRGNPEMINSLVIEELNKYKK